MKAIVVGRYRLGWRWVEVRVNPSHKDGSGWFIPDAPEPQISIIEVGISGSWGIALATLFHEALETVLSEAELRFQACGALSSASADCIFVMTHAQFAEATDRTGHFVASVLPNFRKAYLKHHKKGIKR